ncbi:hypothetical protein HPB50_016259 [Hyalomma asiaticum]|uniref:Uncharacterized protein n=1 Tax=Hyalomma asiaticum TaxID=266040 RepID=A0ACB7TLE3_HYAAI|nr:hypothetical protein HPB50_016259 [Hyalomma asiaticum]
MEFASSKGRPPRPRHRRTPSMPTVLGPPPPELMKLTEERLRQHYAVGGNPLCIVDWWRGTQAAAVTPAFTSADAPELTAPVETQLSPFTAETPTSASKEPPPLLGAMTAPSVGPLDLALPTSDAEEDGMDMATCRKRGRDDVSDDDDAPCPPRKTAASEDDPAGEGPPGHPEACDDIVGSIEAADDMAELSGDEPGPTEPAASHPSPRPLALREPLQAADFLRDAPAAPPAAKSHKKAKKTQKRRRAPAPPAPLPGTSAAPPGVPAAPATVPQPDNTAAAPTYLPAAAEEGDFIEGRRERRSRHCDRVFFGGVLARDNRGSSTEDGQGCRAACAQGGGGSLSKKRPRRAGAGGRS